MTWRYPMQYGGILIKYKRFQAGRSATGNQRINFFGGTQFVHFIAYTTAASSVRGSLRNHRETGRYSGKRRVCVYGGKQGPVMILSLGAICTLERGLVELCMGAMRKIYNELYTNVDGVLIQ